VTGGSKSRRVIADLAANALVDKEEKIIGIQQISLEILGTGECVPSRRVHSEELDLQLGKPPGWTLKHTGVESRAFTDAGEDAISMGVMAAKHALKNADVEVTELDAIIAVGSVPAQPIPCTAAFLQRALGLSTSGIAAFDINATCLGFLAALDLVAQSIATGRYRVVLIVASERPSVGLDWKDAGTAGLFGDGAGAVVVGRARRPGAALLATHFQTFSDGVEFCQMRSGGTNIHPRLRHDEFLAGSVFEMQGRQIYRLAAERLPSFLNTLFERAGVMSHDIVTWVPHQASGHALTHIQNALGISAERLVWTLPTHGNQVAASLPVALHHAFMNGRTPRGAIIAVVGTGAGLSIAGAVLRV
jgi:3-oxoacyl-[acyl-carrier-protein] synthase III